jgi:hypothetical protein
MSSRRTGVVSVPVVARHVKNPGATRDRLGYGVWLEDVAAPHLDWAALEG